MDALSRLNNTPSLSRKLSGRESPKNESSSDGPRTFKLGVFLNEKEMREVKRAAKERGQSVSGYFRWLVLRDINHPV